MSGQMTTSASRKPFFAAEVGVFIAKLGALDPKDVLGRDRGRAALRARAVAYVVLRERGISYPRIGKIFGRDHSTIVHAVDTFDERYAGDAIAHEMLDYARDEFIEPELPPEEINPASKYGFRGMQVGETREFYTPAPGYVERVRKAVYRVSANTRFYFTTVLDDGILRVKRVR